MWLIVRLALFPGLLKFVAKIVWGGTYARLAAKPIEGTYRHAANFNRRIPLDEKLNDLRSEFVGANELCFEIAARVIQIRRGIDTFRNWLFIFGAVLNHPHAVFNGLTLRWIVSILDTFSDMPCAQRYRLAAGELRSFVLGVRLGLTMGLQSVPDVTMNDTPTHFLNKVEIWDGIMHFNYESGDTYRNLIERVARNMEPMPAMREGWKAILKRLVLYPPFDVAFRKNKHNLRAFKKITGSE